MGRRIEVEERDEPGTFIVQWYQDGKRVDIVFLSEPICAAFVHRLVVNPDDPLWSGADAGNRPPEIDHG